MIVKSLGYAYTAIKFKSKMENFEFALSEQAIDKGSWQIENVIVNGGLHLDEQTVS